MKEMPEMISSLEIGIIAYLKAVPAHEGRIHAVGFNWRPLGKSTRGPGGEARPIHNRFPPPGPCAHQLFEILGQLNKPKPDRPGKLDDQVDIAFSALNSFTQRSEKPDRLHPELFVQEFELRTV